MTKTAIVAGGGIAGAVAAIALHRAGYQPVVYEAHGAGADNRGTWLTVAVNGLAALAALDLDPESIVAAGFPTPRLSLTNGSGRQLARIPLGGTTIRRPDLYAALRSEVVARGITVVYGKRLVSRSEAGDRVTAVFADGERATADLLVGADGVHSATRRLLDPAGPAPRFLGLLNSAGFTTAPVEADLDRTPGLMHMAFGKRCFFGWCAAPDGSIWWFANPPAAEPSGPQAEPAWRAHLLELFAADKIPATAIIRATGQIEGPWNTYDLPRVPVWRSARTVLIGDAAHAASPSSGQGASMAMEDAVTLGKCLAAGGDALARYESARRDRVQRVVAAGRRSGSGKAAGPVGAAIRDAITPLVMRMLYRKGNPQAWILDHRV